MRILKDKVFPLVSCMIFRQTDYPETILLNINRLSSEERYTLPFNSGLALEYLKRYNVFIFLGCN